MANDKKVAVRNAADPEQVKDAEEKDKFRREGELLDIKAVLSMPEGRRFIWRMLSFCKTFGSIWEQNAKIHYNSGQQDVGHFLMAEIIEAEPRALLEMMESQQKRN